MVSVPVRSETSVLGATANKTWPLPVPDPPDAPLVTVIQGTLLTLVHVQAVLTVAAVTNVEPEPPVAGTFNASGASV